LAETIGIDFGGQPGLVPPKKVRNAWGSGTHYHIRDNHNWETPIHLSAFTTYPPQIWVFLQYFFTSLRQWQKHLKYSW